MSNGTASDFEALASASKKVISPAHLAHVVLRTRDLEKMVNFYLTFLGARIQHKTDMLAFLTYDYEHHRIAIIAMPDIVPANPRRAGLEHIAFTFSSLTDLLVSYRQRKANGIHPTWSVNHGPTTSIYYTDPDGNMIETQVDAFETSEEANAYMLSEKFTMDPIGPEFEPEELIEKLKAGTSEAELLVRLDSEPKGFPDLLAKKQAAAKLNGF